MFRHTTMAFRLQIKRWKFWLLTKLYVKKKQPKNSLTWPIVEVYDNTSMLSTIWIIKLRLRYCLYWDLNRDVCNLLPLRQKRKQSFKCKSMTVTCEGLWSVRGNFSCTLLWSHGIAKEILNSIRKECFCAWYLALVICSVISYLGDGKKSRRKLVARTISTSNVVRLFIGVFGN